MPDKYDDGGLLGSVLSNYYAGGTMVMNKELRDIIATKRPELSFFNHRIHDEWIASVAQTVGIVMYDPISHMAYRHHSGAFTSTDALEDKNKLSYKLNFYRKKFKQLKKRGFHKHGMSYTAKYLLKLYPEYFTDEEKLNLQIIANYKDSLHNRIRLLKKLFSQ